MISTLVIDLDGPLLDGRQRHYRCYSDILQKHGFEPIPIELYWEMKRSRVDRRELLACSGALSLYDHFLETWLSRIETREYLELDRLQYDVVNVLSTWNGKGLRLLLATMRNSPANLTWQLETLKLRRFFLDVVVVGGGQAGAEKASKVKALLDPVNSDDVLWIGDTEVDIDAARALGVRICAVTCGLRTRDYILSLTPDYIEADLRSLADRLSTFHD